MSHRDRTAWLRRVSNGFAGLAAAGSSLDRQKIAAIRAIATIDQRSRAAYPPTPQLKRQQSPVARFGQAEASYHAISNTCLAHGYLSSSPPRPATQSRSPWPCPVCRNTRQKGDVGSRGAGSSGPARHARRWMGGEFTSPSRISSAIISVEKPCKKTTPLAASRNNPSLMTSACRASNLHRAILLPSDNLVNVVSCTQGH